MIEDKAGDASRPILHVYKGSLRPNQPSRVHGRQGTHYKKGSYDPGVSLVLLPLSSH
jgi:hypothetical protein